jgi:GT2 family glycosyltransferase
MAKNAQIDVTLSIVNTNNRALLRRCLDTIGATVRQSSYEVIVVDNASDDGSCEMLSSDYPHVKVIRNATRKGYGDSHNRAIQESRGDFILVLNEDMEMLEGAIDKMVTKARAIADLGVLGCRILNPDGSLQHSCFNFPTLSQELFEAAFPYTAVLPTSRVRQKMYWWDHDTERDVDIVLGCCMLLPRKAIALAGVFDPSFFVYSEEHDLCRRMRDSGLRVVFTPEAEMIHFGGQSTKHISLKMALVQLDSRIRYFHKHRGAFAALAFRAILAIATGIRLVAWAVLYCLPSKRTKQVVVKLEEYLASTKLIVAWKK